MDEMDGLIHDACDGVEELYVVFADSVGLIRSRDSRVILDIPSAHKVFVKMLRKQMAGIHDFVELPIILRDSYGSMDCCSYFVFDPGKQIEFPLHIEEVETLVILIFDPGGLDCNGYGLRFVRNLTLKIGWNTQEPRRHLRTQFQVLGGTTCYFLNLQTGPLNLAKFGAELAAVFASPICCCILLIPTDGISS